MKQRLDAISKIAGVLAGNALEEEKIKNYLRKMKKGALYQQKMFDGITGFYNDEKLLEIADEKGFKRQCEECGGDIFPNYYNKCSHRCGPIEEMEKELDELLF